MNKKLYSVAGLLAITLINSSSASAHSAVDVEALSAVAKLQSAGKLTEAYELATQSIEKIRGEIGVDRAVKTIQNNLTIVQEKVVTEHHSRSGSDSFWYSWFDGIVSGFGSSSYSSNYDVTRLIERNPDESAAFPLRADFNKQALKTYLVDYVNEYAGDLVTLKSLGIQAFQLIVQRADKGDWTSQPEMEKILLATEGLHFVGQQQVTVCVQTHHAASFSSESSSSLGSFDWLGIFREFASWSSSSSDRYNAYQEGSCSSSVNTVAVSDADLVYKINLGQLDETLRKWVALASMKATLQSPNQPLFPTWGNPYYRD